MEPIQFPIRINRYLAIKGFVTRRGADELITKRWVTINGRIALLGDIVQKTDVVEVDKKITPHVLRLLERGVDIEGYHTKPSRAQFVADHKLRIVLYEGKKHQIRRMLAALGLQVRSLKRVRIMNIELGKLKEGEMRKITGDELKMFLSALGLAPNILKK